MRKQYINYPLNLPINISFYNIKNYPSHWHNSIEIIYVLQGNLNITIDTDTFLLKELSKKSENTRTDLSNSLETNIRKIYLDLGEGFNEDDTVIFEASESDEVEINFCDKGNIKQIRIDLSESRLLVEINEIRLCYKDYEKIVDVKKWISNATYIKENLYFFLTKDPFIIIDEENLLGIKSIKINFKVIEEGF